MTYNLTSTLDYAFENVKWAIDKLKNGDVFIEDGDLHYGDASDADLLKMNAYPDRVFWYDGKHKQEVINLFIRWETQSHTGCGPCREAFKERVRVHMAETLNKIRKEIGYV